VPFSWIPAFAGMTDSCSLSSFPRTRESPAAVGLPQHIEMLSFYESRKPYFTKKGNNKARTMNKRLPSSNTIEKLLTNAFKGAKFTKSDL